MTKTPRLNDLQLVLLSNAAARDNGSLVPLPESCVTDAARIGKAITSLLSRHLVEELPVTDRTLCWREENQDMIGLFITGAGRTAINAKDDATSSDGKTTASEHDTATAQRTGSKIASVVALLERNEGATLNEMVAATGWLPHTTRAALTGLRKKGHVIARTKRGDTTCYQITAEG